MYKLLLDIPTQFETEHLLLRCYQPGDGKWYYEAGRRNREHLARYEAGNVLNTLRNEIEAETAVRDFAKRWLERDWFMLAVFEKATGEFVAQIYIGAVNWDLPEFELGYIADVDHEGRGYVTEAARGALRFAFEHLGAHKVRLECDDTNTRSFRVAERCGMALEGHIRENKRNADGSISGTLHYGMLLSDFEARYRWAEANSRNRNVNGLTWAVLSLSLSGQTGGKPHRRQVHPPCPSLKLVTLKSKII